MDKASDRFEIAIYSCLCPARHPAAVHYFALRDGMIGDLSARIIVSYFKGDEWGAMSGAM